MEDQVTAKPSRQPQTEVADPNFAAPDEKNYNSTLTNQVLLVSRPVRTKLFSAPRQQNPRFGIFKNMAASTEDWQFMSHLSLVQNEGSKIFLWRLLETKRFMECTFWSIKPTTPYKRSEKETHLIYQQPYSPWQKSKEVRN